MIKNRKPVYGRIVRVMNFTVITKTNEYPDGIEFIRNAAGITEPYGYSGFTLLYLVGSVSGPKFDEYMSLHSNDTYIKNRNELQFRVLKDNGELDSTIISRIEFSDYIDFLSSEINRYASIIKELEIAKLPISKPSTYCIKLAELRKELQDRYTKHLQQGKHAKIYCGNDRR